MADHRVDVAGGQRGVELAEKGGHTSIGRCVEHHVLRWCEPAFAGGLRCSRICPPFETLATRDAPSIAGRPVADEGESLSIAVVPSAAGLKRSPAVDMVEEGDGGRPGLTGARRERCLAVGRETASVKRYQ